MKFEVIVEDGTARVNVSLPLRSKAQQQKESVELRDVHSHLREKYPNLKIQKVLEQSLERVVNYRSGHTEGYWVFELEKKRPIKKKIAKAPKTTKTTPKKEKEA